MESNLKLSVNNAFPLLTDTVSYKRLIGRLPYLIITKLDIAYSIQTLSQFMAHPRLQHLQVAERVLRYIKATLG